MDILEIIAKKRDGEALSREQIEFFAQGAAQGTIPDYQLAAILMAICIRGMDARETADLTLAMMHSGQVADLSAIPGVKVDKHSTGGIGDTVTLVAVPLAAACGCRVTKMSGRALGYTGGTIDKMESVGMKTELTVEQIIEQVNKIGCAVAAQSGELAPADKALYALRDVTGTVSSIPLIASSILSKKFATGSDAIVLDVKTGSGALMKSLDDAVALAQTMCDIGAHAGKRVCAMVTDMSQQLGNFIGNRLEVYEAALTLRGEAYGPLTDISVLVSAKMVEMSLGLEENEAKRRVLEALWSGNGYRKLIELVQTQGGDAKSIENPELLRAAAFQYPVFAQEQGYIRAMDAEKLGYASHALGAGRAKKDDVIDPDVGIEMKVRIGDYVRSGTELATLYFKEETQALQAEQILLSAVSYSKDPVEPQKLVHRVLTSY